MTQAYDRELEDELELESEDEALSGATSLLREDEYESEYELEAEYEAEEELEGSFEDEFSHELLGEFEDELEGEDEYEIEGEEELEDEDEAFLGGLAQIAGSLLGEGEDELEAEGEEEYFFKKIGRFVKRHSGLLKKIAKIAGPMIATAVGGPAAGAAARLLTRQLEGEFEDEMEAELEELATAPITPSQAFGEYLAAKAATTESESEAEAFAGSAVTISLTARDRARLENMLPHLLRGASVLTRVLYRNPGSRPAIRLVPGIVASAGQTLARHSAGGAIRPGRRRGRSRWRHPSGIDRSALAVGCGSPSRSWFGACASSASVGPRWRTAARPTAPVLQWPPGHDQAPPDAHPYDADHGARYASANRIRAGRDPCAGARPRRAPRADDPRRQ